MLKANKSSWNDRSRSGSSPRGGDHARSRHAEPWERTIDCRRAQGCAHSSRTSRSAKSPLPTRSRIRLFRSRHRTPTHRVEALDRLTEEDAEADRRFITTLTISNAHGGLPAPGFSAAPDVSAGSYD